MKGLFMCTLTAALLFCGNISAQRLNELYVARPQASGTLYYIFPLTLFESKSNGEFIFDLTCLQPGDSVTVNFTYTHDSVLALDSLRFRSNGSNFGGRAQKIYVEAQKPDVWIHRYTFKCPMALCYAFFRSRSSATVCCTEITRVSGMGLKRANGKRSSRK